MRELRLWGTGLSSIASMENRGWFTYFMQKQRQRKQLVVQPRMGFGTLKQMRRGLLAVQMSHATVAGTITLDSYTRVNNYEMAWQALAEGHELNGFPLVTHGPDQTRKMLSDVASKEFPIQVRHGSALPLDIFKAILLAGLDATEGGPVSYCLPYSRIPIWQAMEEWKACCQLFASELSWGKVNHIESFGGCMLGQLCPPSLLIAISLLECLFLRFHGLRSLSLSYAQQTNLEQDKEAVMVLRHLAERYLPNVDWHIVIYTYMGVYPRSFAGATALLRESVKLAVDTGSERLIVKTPVEASRIPTIEENVTALEMAAESARAFSTTRSAIAQSQWHASDTGVYTEAERLIEAVLELNSDPGEALVQAFAKGLLDIPYCLHPDNRNLARSFIDQNGWLRWADPGYMPILDAGSLRRSIPKSIKAQQLIEMLTYNERRFDDPGSRLEVQTMYELNGSHA